MIKIVKTLARSAKKNLRSKLALWKGGDQYFDTPPSTLGSKLIEERGRTAKAIFFHIHKCGGSSVSAATENNEHIIVCGSIPGDYLGRTGRNLVPDELWGCLVKFTVVRNPYARVLSAYAMFSRSNYWKSLFPTFDHFTQFLSWVNVHEHEIPNQVSLDEFKQGI